MSHANRSTAFILVPGGFCPAAYYHRVTTKLVEKGYEVVELNLPSVGRRTEGPATLYDDARSAQTIMRNFANQGKEVILVGNSYGGVVITEAAKGFSKSERQAAGEAGALVHLVYLSSLVMPVGMTTEELVGGKVPAQMTSQGEYIDPPASAGQNLFSELNAEEQVHYAKGMQCHSALSFASKLTYAGYEHIPTTMVVSENDQTLTPQLQHENVDAAIAGGIGKIRKVTLDSDHISMLSRPDEIVRILLEAVGATN